MAGFLDGVLFAGRREKELADLRRRAAAEPGNPRLRVRIGDLLERMGKRGPAVEAYRAAAEAYVRNGFLIQAIAVNKLLLRLDPEQADLQGRIAGLYARWGKEREELAGAPGGAEGGGEASGLPAIPLFSDLGKEELSGVMEKIRARSFPRGRAICREGEPGDSIFILSRGQVRVTRKPPGQGTVVLGELKEGDFFGEFGFFSNSLRQATVEASTDAEVLEITKEDLQKIIGEFPSVSRVLFKFYRERVLDTILATSSLFRDFSPAERRQVLERLTVEEFSPGARVIEEGTAGDCLYIVKSGEVEVFTLDLRGEKRVLASLREGDYFGEISLLTGRPRTASVAALRRTELARLGKEDFDRVVAGRPGIQGILEEALQARMENKLRMLGVFRDSPAKEAMV